MSPGTLTTLRGALDSLGMMIDPDQDVGSNVLSTRDMASLLGRISSKYSLFSVESNGVLKKTTPKKARKKLMRKGNMSKLCAVCHGTAGKKCGKCDTVRYCSRKCQRKHWKSHKKICASFQATQK